jgi:formate-dependent phosphoribosylglycinamide formyltransferase (GAR transformylase)
VPPFCADFVEKSEQNVSKVRIHFALCVLLCANMEVGAQPHTVTPTARAARLTMDREGIRRFASETLGLPASQYRFATSAGRIIIEQFIPFEYEIRCLPSGMREGHPSANLSVICRSMAIIGNHGNPSP